MIIKKENGFTLIEFLVVIAVIGIIGVGLNAAFISGYKFYRLGNDRAEIQRSIRLVETILNKNVKYAESIKVKNKKKPASESSFEEEIQLSSGSNGNYSLSHNGRIVTDEIIKEMNILSFTNTNLELKFIFIDDTEIIVSTLLNNL